MNTKKIIQILDKMDYYEKNNEHIFILLNLRNKLICNYIQKFIDSSKSDIKHNSEMLDIIERIIVHAKTIYEIDRYVEAYDDDFYDQMLSKFKKFRPEPFGNNGLGLANAKYKYDELSGTLDKCHFIKIADKTDERDSVEEWFDDIPVSNNDTIAVFVNHKEDGASMTVDYKYSDKSKSYKADSAISRGRKDYGEGTDVSIVAPTCGFRSDYIEELLGYIPKYIGVQYEFLVSDRNMKLLGEYLGQSFSNNRSAAAGLMRRILHSSKDEQQKLKQFMSLVPVGFHIDNINYSVYSWDKVYTTVCKTFLYGDIFMEYDLLIGTKSEILDQFEKLANKVCKKREKLNHAIDGLVLTLLDSELQDKLGRKNNINKWQVAYKFPEKGKKTVIRDVEITTGNFGYKEILLIVDPVILNGTKQFKAQVHSLKKFNKMKLRIGDEIILKLSGDVIPFGFKDSTCKEGDGKKIKLPKYCECGAVLEEEKNKLRCTNRHCPFRVIGSLNNFFTELNAKGIGEKTCEQLHNELGINKPSEILKLTEKDFRSLSGFKEKSAKLAMDTINDIISRPRTIASIMSALGIDSFRTSTANKLLEVIDYDNLIEAIDSRDKDYLISVIRKADGIDKNAKIIAEGLLVRSDELKELVKLMTIKESNNTKFDKTIVISGIRHDEELEQVANSAGYLVKDNGKKFDILVIKDDSMMNKSKAKYALSKSIPIMTRKEFIDKYGK